MSFIPFLVALQFLSFAQNGEASNCHRVDGRMFLSNGTPSVRIFLPSENRVLGVIQQDERFDELPADLRRIWSAQGSEAMWDSDLVGEFVVCDLELRRRGEMQRVSVVGAGRLTVSSRR